MPIRDITKCYSSPWGPADGTWVNNPQRMALCSPGNRRTLRVCFRSLCVLGIFSLTHGENSLRANSPELEELVRSDAVNAYSAPELVLAKELAVRLNALAARGTTEAVQGLGSGTEF